jgi:hypothetical protein
VGVHLVAEIAHRPWLPPAPRRFVLQIRAGGLHVPPLLAIVTLPVERRLSLSHRRSHRKGLALLLGLPLVPVPAAPVPAALLLSLFTRRRALLRLLLHRQLPHPLSRFGQGQRGQLQLHLAQRLLYLQGSLAHIGQRELRRRPQQLLPLEVSLQLPAQCVDGLAHDRTPLYRLAGEAAELLQGAKGDDGGAAGLVVEEHVRLLHLQRDLLEGALQERPCPVHDVGNVRRRQLGRSPVDGLRWVDRRRSGSGYDLHRRREAALRLGSLRGLLTRHPRSLLLIQQFHVPEVDCICLVVPLEDLVLPLPVLQVYPLPRQGVLVQLLPEMVVHGGVSFAIQQGHEHKVLLRLRDGRHVVTPPPAVEADLPSVDLLQLRHPHL